MSAPTAFQCRSTRCVAGRARKIAYDAKIEGHANGNLEFEGIAVPKTDFLTARTGFVVLHPLKGVAGRPVTVEHIDGTVVNSQFRRWSTRSTFSRGPRAHA